MHHNPLFFIGSDQFLRKDSVHIADFAESAQITFYIRFALRMAHDIKNAASTLTFSVLEISSPRMRKVIAFAAPGTFAFGLLTTLLQYFSYIHLDLSVYLHSTIFRCENIVYNCKYSIYVLYYYYARWRK